VSTSGSVSAVLMKVPQKGQLYLM